MIFKNEMQSPAQSPVQSPMQSPLQGVDSVYLTSQINFIFRARMLLRDLATWLRSYKVSLYGGVGNTAELSQRLFWIPMEYGDFLKVFFGDETTEQLISLLTQYIAILESLFIAQINNDINAINNLTQQAYQNVNETAALLSSVNPYWTQSEWVTRLSSFTNMLIHNRTAIIFRRVFTLAPPVFSQF